MRAAMQRRNSLSFGVARLTEDRFARVPQKRSVADSSGREGVLEALMVRYQTAEPEAGALLVEKLSPAIFQYFLAQVRSRADAEDLLQDFWLRIHNARHTYRPGEPVLPWAYAIARRVKIDDYRRNRKARQHEPLDEELLHTPPPPAKAAHPPITELLRDLPESQRQVILMMKVSGLSLEEVARATGSTVGAVKQKAHRGYERLRSLLGDLA
jgi:RNA polymerase sigma-70 factor (ECF subfamily)